MAKTEVIKGTVKAVNQKQTGLTFGNVGPDGKDVWYTFTKEEWREPGFYIPSKGDSIETIIKDDTFIISCLPMRNGANIVPPSEGFYEGPPDEVYERDINADVPKRKRSTDESIQLQVCVKVSGEIMVAKIRAGIFLVDKTPEEIGAEVAAMASSIATVFSE